MRQFITVGLNGVTLGALYFLVASGFTLIFGLMRVVNLAHGALYLLGGYLGWSIADRTGSWPLGVVAAALAIALVGLAIQQGLLRRIQGQELREALVTIALSIIFADLMLARYGGLTYEFDPPAAINRSTDLHVGGVIYPTYRLFLLGFTVLVGLLLWLMLNRARIGLIIRAGIDDRDMVSTLGINVERAFALVFALGAALAGIAGVVGGSALSISTGEDGRYLLASLIVVIVGGMGSLEGAAIGAIAVGLVEQYGLAYEPTYSVIITFALMVLVLALRPQGLLGRAA